MKLLQVEIADDVYESLEKEAERTGATVDEVIRGRIGETPRKWAIEPIDLGLPKIPVSEWREVANEGRVP